VIANQPTFAQPHGNESIGLENICFDYRSIKHRLRNLLKAELKYDAEREKTLAKTLSHF